MNDREKYRAKIETQMTNFNETIEEIVTKAKLRKESQPEIDIESLLKKHEDAKNKLKELDTTDENNWQKIIDHQQSWGSEEGPSKGPAGGR